MNGFHLDHIWYLSLVFLGLALTSLIGSLALDSTLALNLTALTFIMLANLATVSHGVIKGVIKKIKSLEDQLSQNQSET